MIYGVAIVVQLSCSVRDNSKDVRIHYIKYLEDEQTAILNIPSLSFKEMINLINSSVLTAQNTAIILSKLEGYTTFESISAASKYLSNSDKVSYGFKLVKNDYVSYGLGETTLAEVALDTLNIFREGCKCSVNPSRRMPQSGVSQRWDKINIRIQPRRRVTSDNKLP